MIAQIWGK